MKKLLTLIAAVFISIQLFAQAPQKMSYQAVIRNASNNLVTNAPVKMRISILQGSAQGTSVYSELHSATTNANGLVSVEIGNGTSQQGKFSSINWGNGTYFLKTETDPNNGTTYSIVGTSQLLSVPYALESKNSETAGNGIKSVSSTGDTLTLSNGEKFIVPGIKKIVIPPSTINNGLVAYYPFNGNANDESGNGNNGMVNGATLTEDRAGSVNKAFNFDGIDDYIEVPFASKLQFSNSFSINCWTRINDLTTNQNPNWKMRVLVGKPRAAQGSGFFLFALNESNHSYGGGIRNSYPDGYEVLANDTLNLGEWTNLTLTYNGAALKIYKNGALMNEQDCTLFLDPVEMPLFFGKEFFGEPSDSRWFKGQIDDIRIYNRALTQEEITYLYNN